MNVKLMLDPKLVWAAEERAEAQGLTLSELVALLLTPEQTKRSRAADATRHEVVRLHGEGFTDAEISEHVGRVQEHVARLRRSAGLKPNRRKVVVT